MSELSGPVTRRRSRSKTPFTLLQSQAKEQENNDNGPTKIAPSVDTIVEEEVDLSTIARPTRNTRKTVSATSSSESPQSQNTNSGTTSSVQSVAESRSTTVVTTTSSSSSIITSGKTTKKVSAESAAAAAASSISQSSTTTSKEQSQNAQNAMLEESAILSHSNIQTSTPINSAKRKILNAISSPIAAVFGSGQIEEHAPYREYRDAGEYWNKYPKTDYTYSKLSPHRRELAPGIVAMPNMSRRSLESHHSRVDQMAHANPDQESYIRTRYQSRKSAVQNRQHESFYDSQDSQDELDVVSNNSYRNRSDRSLTTRTSFFQRIIIVKWITTMVTYFWESISNKFRGHNESDMYYTRLEENKGWFRRVGSAISSGVWSVVRCVYTAISSVLFLDSWLLKSRSSSGTAKKRFLLLLLILLPLLLLAAWRLRSGDSTPLPFRLPPIPIGLPISLAAFRNLKFPKFDWLWSNNINLAPTLPHDSSMTDDQYRELLEHLRRYVESLVNQKVQASEQKLSESIFVNIANTVNEHFHTNNNNQYVLNEADINRIADKVRILLVNERSSTEAPIAFTNEHVIHISKLVKEHLSSDPVQSNAVSELNVDDMLLQILSSPKLAEIIDQRVLLSKTQHDSEIIVKQQQLIETLRLEIDSINSKLNQNFESDKQVQQTIIILQSNHENIENSFKEFVRENEKKLAGLLRDVDARLLDANSQQFAAVDARVKVILMDILGYKTKTGETPSDADLKGWIENMFLAKDELEHRLHDIHVQSDLRMQEAIDRSAGVLMQNIGDRIREQTTVLIERNNVEVLGVKEGTGSAGARIPIDLNVDEIKRIVKEALAVYDADKTGLVDYALESAGGEIISTRCTETYHTKTAQISIFGIPLWYPTNTPRTAISPTVQPGQCWAFQGFPGFLVLKLNTYIHVTGFTIEHIPKSLSPNGKIDSAPKTFTVWGLESEDDHEPLQFGTYEFIDDNVSNLQYFPVQMTDIERLHNIVELRIESNHGNANYTCLYRFRVHGTTTDRG